MRISRILYTLMVVASIVATAASTSFGQPPGGGRRGMGGGPFGGGGGLSGLLRMEEVQKELKLDDDQKKELAAIAEETMAEITKLMPNRGPGAPGGASGAPPGGRFGAGMSPEEMEKWQASMASLRAKAEAKLSEILDPAQLDRLMGLSIQRDGTRSFNSKLVAERVGITDDQKTKIAEIEKAAGEEMRALFSGGPSEDGFTKMQAIQKGTDEKVMALLNDKQKAEVETLKGEKFEFPAPPFGPGGPGGRRGGNRGGNGA